MNSVTIKQKTKKRNKKQDTKIDYWEFRLNWKDPKRNEVIIPWKMKVEMKNKNCFVAVPGGGGGGGGCGVRVHSTIQNNDLHNLLSVYLILKNKIVCLKGSICM